MSSRAYRPKPKAPAPPIVFDARLRLFVDPSNPRKRYMGVHAAMRWMFRGSWSLEALHKQLESRVPCAPPRGRGLGGMEFGSLVHDHAAELINSGRFSRKHLDRDDEDFACMASFMKLMKDECQLMPFRGDLPVKMESRMLATGADTTFHNGRVYFVVELKVFRSILVADYTDEKTPVFDSPFHNLPCTPGFLAEVQAEITCMMFRKTYPLRSPAKAAVAVIDRGTGRAYWRPCSEAARVASRALLKLMDLRECHSSGESSAEIFRLAKQAEETGLDYEELKREEGSDELNLLEELTEQVNEAQFPRAMVVEGLQERSASPALARKIASLVFSFL